MLRLAVCITGIAAVLAGCQCGKEGSERPSFEGNADNANVKQRLLGNWRTDPSDSDSLERFDSVRLRFEDDGTLAYVIETESTDQVILLTFEVDGDELVTDQPSAPGIERTRFRFTRDGLLVLERDGESSRYVRAYPEDHAR